MFIYFILYQSISSSTNEKIKKNFTVIWNVPSFKCEDRFGINLNLEKYGFITNKGGAFRGDAVTIFYRKDLGLYPWIDRDGTFINGGLPQVPVVLLFIVVIVVGILLSFYSIHFVALLHRYGHIVSTKLQNQFFKFDIASLCIMPIKKTEQQV